MIGTRIESFASPPPYLARFSHFLTAFAAALFLFPFPFTPSPLPVTYPSYSALLSHRRRRTAFPFPQPWRVYLALSIEEVGTRIHKTKSVHFG